MNAPTRTHDLLLERDRELGSLDRVLDEAAAGGGRTALVEGPAGIGKSRLLAELRTRAERAGMRVLGARGSELEREFPFGVVRQLFEPLLADPAAREHWLVGAAAPADAVLDPLGAASEPSAAEPLGDSTFATLHGLYWLTANAAADGPLVLSLDDLHWCDRGSLRYLTYLVRRLEGLPVLVAATLRSTDPGTDPALIAEIANDPATISVRPGPLSEEATTEIVRERLGSDADRRFGAACHHSTGGNPLLLRQLLSSLEADGVTPDVAHLDVVRDIGPRAVSRTVILRLARLSPEAVSVAGAVAVLGEGADLAVLGELAGVSEERAAAATGELVRAEVLRPDPPIDFVHPLVRDAVYTDLPPGERELKHARAAELLRGAGASPDRVAAHLLAVPRRGESRVVELLREAATAATRRGAPESAAAYLRRALEEPAPADQRPALLLELGHVEQSSFGPDAEAHLREARSLLSDPAARGQAAAALAYTLLFTDTPWEAAPLARDAAAELPAELADLRQMLEAIEVMTVFLGGADPMLLEEFRERVPEGDGPGAKMLTAAHAFIGAVTGGSREECVELAVRALDGGELLEADQGLFWIGAIVALALADDPLAIPAIEEARAEAYRSGSLFSSLSVQLWSGAMLLARGELDEAEELLTNALESQELWGSGRIAAAYVYGFLASTQMERGELAAAAQTIKGALPVEGPADAVNFWRRAHAALLMHEGRAEDALAVSEEMRQPHVTHPMWNSWRAIRAAALAALDRRDEARELLEEELALARDWGSPSLLGRCLRQLGSFDGEAGLPMLREAVETLAGSGARLEHAHALSALGTVLRRAGKPKDSREPLRRALELAERCGAAPLAEHARSELYAAGSRPRTTALDGVESLTERELRVATLASGGQTNRDIAQALYVTPKTVEVHLTSVYRKLGIGSRRQLPGALAA